MNLWLDDIRPAPDGWIHVKSVNDAINWMSENEFDLASLDHDLGDYSDQGGDATKLTDWMAENNVWPTKGIQVHSANPVGVQTMLRTIDNYSPYPVGYGSRRGSW